MNLVLTPEQAIEVLPLIRNGSALFGRVIRERFDGENAETSGRLMLELGTIPESAIPALREAIRKANK